jgi:hypothetical protein
VAAADEEFTEFATGNVKSQSARALGKLRAVLGEDGAQAGGAQAGLRQRRDSSDG